jgi:phosphomannomutase
MADLMSRAREWIAGDPDPETRAELERLIESGDQDELATRMGPPLEFGTAGLRGPLGAGPSGMNQAVVIKATAGLAAYLDQGPEGIVVVGFDARPKSRDFAESAAGVLSAHGISVAYFPEVTPTPLVAFAAKHLEAIAAVVVTASHNPPQDNGYKVYGSNAAQIIPPADVEIARHIEKTGPASEIPRHQGVFESTSYLVEEVPPSIFDAYWSEVAAVRVRDRGSTLKVVYTPIHGVGGKAVGEVFRRAGHDHLFIVPEQAAPDGTFPTVKFPNPEEPGTLDLARAHGEERNADLILANDPDADRLAAMVSLAGGFRSLSGNELGVLIGDYLLGGHQGPKRPIVVSSVVSSPMMSLVAAAHGARHVITLTGFKWIANAGLALEEAGEGRFIFGYEEALGYTVGSVVRDKDGISAALIFTDLTADSADRGETAIDRLHGLWRAHGIWASAQVSIPGAPEVLVEAVDRLAANPPESLAGRIVQEVTDFRRGADRRPPWLGTQDLVELMLEDGGRALVRPSGTEPKLKIYVDLNRPYGEDAESHHDELKESAATLGEELSGMMGL